MHSKWLEIGQHSIGACRRRYIKQPRSSVYFSFEDERMHSQSTSTTYVCYAFDIEQKWYMAEYGIILRHLFWGVGLSVSLVYEDFCILSCVYWLWSYAFETTCEASSIARMHANHFNYTCIHNYIKNWKRLNTPLVPFTVVQICTTHHQKIA